ncbi:MAG TPA: 30S ribosomal protein S20 [Deltaproteobacteria bacterium]|nr:30S ribosomal protein S20 [Deltaproteobacteria bacterium]
MATHKSAEKRDRQNKKRRARNISVKSALRTKIKVLDTAAAGKKKPEAAAALKAAAPALAKAASKGVIHKKTASRKISRLTKKVNALK